MQFTLHSLSFFSIVIFSLLHIPTHAIKKSYIVYLGEHSHGSEVTSADLVQVTNSHYQFLSSFLQNSNERPEDVIFYSYTRNINGFAAILDEEQAAEIAKHPKVVSVLPNLGRKLHTTHSWELMGLERYGNTPPQSLWKRANYGEDIIIANLDTGVFPESKSFDDEGMGPVPSKWKGICQNGNKEEEIQCNRKLLGVRYFQKGYEAYAGHQLNSSFQTARDHSGHGTHTLSTAGGNFVPGANVLGHGNGTAKGGSPKARVASYKVCWPPIDGAQCFDADIMAAIDVAMSDGVDVLSLSLGGSPIDYFNDAIAIGSFHAIKKGIVVVCSAGNDGPMDGSVSNVAPWILTVGASTIDREFVNYVALGNKRHFKGSSLSEKGLPHQKFYPLISAADAKAGNVSSEDALLCEAGTLDPKLVKGKILVCQRGDNARVEKGQQAALAGAVAMILVNDEVSGNELVSDPHILPASHISYADGLELFSYLKSTKNPMAYMTNVKTLLGTKPAPVMAAFSSKGPNSVTPEILKPDITAPGVSVIAAYTNLTSPTELSIDHRIFSFNIESGTSMSCPHISGIVGLLKKVHPNWSPAAIKSAIMTTARTRANTDLPMITAAKAEATPFSYGGGHVRPNRAVDPGLVYDLIPNDYIMFLCGLGYNQTQIDLFTKGSFCPKSFKITDLNYPSITVPNLSGTVTVSRTLKNVGSPGTYHGNVKSPPGISVELQPKSLKFEKIGEEKSFKLLLKATGSDVAKDYVFGRLLWSDGTHNVRSPIVVRSG